MDERDERENITQETQESQEAQADSRRRAEEGDSEAHLEGNIHISEDVIVELAKKTIQGIANIQTANTRLAAKFGLGRKAGDGIRVSVENGATPSVSVDAYVLVRYGQRIPDLAWDVQEKVKANLERYTGYIVKAVNINVQGIYIDEPVILEEPPEGAEGTEEDVIEGNETGAADTAAEPLAEADPSSSDNPEK